MIVPWIIDMVNEMDIKKIEVELENDFTLELDSNPTTGYTWQAEFDERVLKLKDKKFVPYSKAIGSGGEEKFTFEPIKKGETVIRMYYKRVWEKSAIEEKIYKVLIK